MADKSTFSAEEWSVLRSVPHIVGMAIAGAGGGIFGAVKEAMSAARIVAENSQSPSPLIHDICNVEEAKEAEEALRKTIMADVSNMTSEKLKAMAVDSTQQATAILKSKATDELAAYRDLILQVADGVAKAAKEGGFFGFGGELVSPGESAVISAISAVLQ